MLNPDDSNLAMNAICNAAVQAGNAWEQTAYDLLRRFPEGITLRDVFAGLALAGLVSSNVRDCQNGTQHPDRYADDAYAIADSMIERRKS